MIDALRHARLLHYAIVALSLLFVAVFAQVSPLAEVYHRARTELAVLEAFLGRTSDDGRPSEIGTERMEEARDLIGARVAEHVHWVLSRNLSMALGRDVDPDLSVRWQVPIAHESELPLDSDLAEIRAHFAAIPIVVLQPDLAELVWLLSSKITAQELRRVENLTIVVDAEDVLAEHLQQSGFESVEEGTAIEVAVRSSDDDGGSQRIEATLVGRITRMPDLNQRAAFHNSFPELERVFPLIEGETPAQADLKLAEFERGARSGLLTTLASSSLFRLAALLVMPLALLFLLAHVRHLLAALPGMAPPETAEVAWFPLFADSNSRGFEVLTLMILPAVGPATWVGTRLVNGLTIPIEDILLYSAASLVSLWIGSSIRTDLEELRACLEDGAGIEKGA